MTTFSRKICTLLGIRPKIRMDIGVRRMERERYDDILDKLFHRLDEAVVGARSLRSTVSYVHKTLQGTKLGVWVTPLDELFKSTIDPTAREYYFRHVREGLPSEEAKRLAMDDIADHCERVLREGDYELDVYPRVVLTMYRLLNTLESPYKSETTECKTEDIIIRLYPV